MFQEIKRLTGNFRLRRSAIKEENGEVQTNPNRILECWGSYCQKQYTDPDEHTGIEIMCGEHEPGIIVEEIEQAVSKLKNNKAPGPDGVTAEMLKLSGENGLMILWKLCNEV